MTLKKPSIVIFDMDGTTVRHVNPRLLYILEFLDDASFKFHRFWGRLFRRGDKATIYETIDYENIKKRKLIVHRAMHKVRRKPVEQIVEPCPGIYAVLSLLKSLGVPMAIASNGLGKGYGHEVLRKFELEEFFSSAIFREDIRHSKPNPEAILASLKNLQTQNLGGTDGGDNVVWYIGDRHKDIAAAIAAQKHVTSKIEPIAYGLQAALAVLEKNLGADHIMTSYYEMHEILKNLFIGQPQPIKTI